MLSKFWETTGSTLAQRWVDLLISPAFFFWCGGAVVWISRNGWASVNSWWLGQPTWLQAGMVIGAMALSMLLAKVVQYLEVPALRLLEGYWPSWVDPLRERIIGMVAKQIQKDEERFQVLSAKEATGLTRKEYDELNRLDRKLMALPGDSMLLMPTRLGRILRSAELKPNEKYGLDAVVCWARLWFLLPEATRSELIAVRGRLNSVVQYWTIGLMFLLWAIWEPWAVVVGLVIMFASYRAALEHALIYSQFIEAVFDVYRTELYKALRLPLPKNAAEERELGSQLSQYLWRGSDNSSLGFE